jgi:hypothetical protein
MEIRRAMQMNAALLAKQVYYTCRSKEETRKGC